MSTEERARHELHGRLTDVLGPDEATTLMGYLAKSATMVRTFMLATAASVLTIASLAFAAARFA